MCGIIGYIGHKNAVPILLDGLARLEYRGYDSSGLSVMNGRGNLRILKKVGPLANLVKLIEPLHLDSSIGLGHTRWATHGRPLDHNAHPHGDCIGSIAVIHNGIIENFQELKEALQKKGHRFSSDTDTEMIAHEIEETLAKDKVTLEEAVRKTLQKLKGTYALGVMHQAYPDLLIAARKGSPLVIGLGKDENFIASDVSPLLTETRKVIYLQDEQMAVLKRNECKVKNLLGRTVRSKIDHVSWNLDQAEKGGFEKFMLKEIHEQPGILKNVWMGRIDLKKGSVRFESEILTSLQIKVIRRVIIIACGTAYYAGLCGKYILEHYTNIPVEVDLGSEFRYRPIKVSRGTLVIAVSQSGETADTLASIRKAKELGCRVLSIVNVVGSTLTRESHSVIYTQAGPEIGVASTKAYLTQLAAFYLLSVYLGRAKHQMPDDVAETLLSELVKIPDKIQWVLDHQESIKACAKKYYRAKSSFYLGRGFNYPTALEGALKNKEISYSHAEAYAAGEMKHGPIALIDKTFPVVCICTRGSVYEKMISNVKEIQARRGKLIIIANSKDRVLEELADDRIEVPETLEELSPLVNVIPLQLLAYYLALYRGCDIDRPRNLAKSVTVE
ncbi:MAG: glutamine--fructose-6-phosphate transaminase (isomerizing) [Chlamydiae bacterium]|nr:glutamine--fructose-6-phosphate transaminase (isomerizing) [Chlamydiota bacterium]MBI3277424.1 glutamine--fructose-6-phosphate transaminase (isomerizing) [Chlamydiota bacterium]